MARKRNRWSAFARLSVERLDDRITPAGTFMALTNPIPVPAGGN